jgi:hypothetical protein
MKSILLACLLAIGCVPGTGATDVQFPTQQDDTPAPQDDSSPRFVTPVDGSAGPVLATPLGGSMYMPVTGGAPIIGM